VALDQEVATTMSERRTLPLPHDGKSASVARRFVRQFGAEHDLSETDVECLIATELVSNAVRHGAEPVELTLQREGVEVTIEVADGDPRFDDVRIRAVDKSRPGGRGLRIVGSLAKRWGTRPFRSGKQVWATTDATETETGTETADP
jgi:anti-sigma regulatory factor (Ser/Thr protein kinase)